MNAKRVLALAASVASLAVLIGCSTQAKKVDCDGTLKPINPPAPAAAASSRALTPEDAKPPHEK